MREEALQGQRLKEHLTANISHELRTPLNLILGFSEMMYMSPEVYGDVSWSKPLRRDVTRIYEASRHLSQLVDDVLDLSRVQVERLPLHKEMCDVGQIVREAADTVAGLLRGQAVELAVQVEPSLPLLALDATRIRQVLMNLLANAIRFTDEGEIAVQARQQDDEVLVSVSDTGGHSGRRVEQPLRRVLPSGGGGKTARPWRRPGPGDQQEAGADARRPHLGRERGG